MFSSCCGCGNKKANLKVANDDDDDGDLSSDANNCDNNECNESRPDEVTSNPDKNGSLASPSTANGNGQPSAKAINHNEAATVTNGTNGSSNDAVNGKDHQPTSAAVDNEENSSGTRVSNSSVR